MLSLEIYKVIHIFGISLMFLVLGGLAMHGINGGTRDGNQARKLASISHGVAMLIIAVSGFGMLARMDVGHDGGFPAWVVAKVVLWFVFGGVMVLISRKPGWARPLWLALPALGALAAYIAIFEPLS